MKRFFLFIENLAACIVENVSTRAEAGGYRLVTAFSDVGSYSKPQPSLTPDVDSTLRQSLRGDTLLLLIITTHECLL